MSRDEIQVEARNWKGAGESIHPNNRSEHTDDTKGAKTQQCTKVSLAGQKERF